MQKSGWWSESGGSTSWRGRSTTSTGQWWKKNWESGWDDEEEAAWSSAGWQEGSRQDDCGEESRRDRGHDVDATLEQHPWAHCAEEQRGAKGAEEEPPAPEDLAAESTDRQPGAQPVEDDPDALRKLHEDAMRRFLLDEAEPGSDDDGEALAGTQTQMLVDGDDIDAGIAEFDPATGWVTCKLCKMALNSKAQWADHQKGKKHFKKVSAEERKRGANQQKVDTSNHLPAESYQ